ncbi:outer membrane beta-barrel family protein [uncultured Chryseobacterium sp.]|uniref:outer membrane beta-barrel family protein n=1 Tax=uncultured Chryseobacterium sp. TaxID=259322 RepID=UPI0025E8F95B|nr:outer membrane beta-barrel family protein [uncultured Chryseobacterium sp.]
MKHVSILILFFVSIFNYGQDKFNITGTIVNEQKEKITRPVHIKLFDQGNQLIGSDHTQDGLFTFSRIKPGTYYLQVSSDETIQNEKPFLLENNVGLTVIYTPKIQQIEEVTITGKEKNFKVENGNMTIDVADSPLNKLPTSSELLSKLPFVTMDTNGEGLSFIGKGVPLLYIDNQRVDFSTLSAVAVDDIKSVEVIRNPSIKYEAEGKAVIKVNLKKSRRDGAKLTISETASFQKRFSNYLAANFQQKKNKTEWKLNAAFNPIHHWESNGFEYSVPSENIYSDYVIQSVTRRPQTIFGASLYRELNDTGDYITLSLNSNFRPDKGDNTTNTLYSEDGNTSYVKTLNHQDRKRSTVNSIFNYNKKISAWDANIFTGLQFTREGNGVEYDFFNSINSAPYEFSQFRRQRYAGNVYSGRIDFEKKFDKKIILESGGSYTKAETRTHNSTRYHNIQDITYYKYLFKESNLAAYLNLGINGEKWKVKGGLRMETTSANGFDQTVSETKIKRAYIDWFPNAEISFQQNEDQVYTLNFRKSISRPNYGDLASGGLYGSPYVEYAGNPNLIPTYTHTVSFSTNLKKWSFNASVYTSKNPMGYTLVYDETSHISKFTAVNFDKASGSSISVDYPIQWKKWTSQNSLSLNYDTTQDSLAVLKKSTPYLYFSTNNTFAVLTHLSFLLDGSYITKRVEGLYDYNAMCLVNLGVTSSVSNFDFTLRYNDIFNQMNYIQKMSYRQMTSTGTFFGNTPTVSIAVKYNFGKLMKSAYKESTVNENANRL